MYVLALWKPITNSKTIELETNVSEFRIMLNIEYKILTFLPCFGPKREEIKVL